MLRAALTFAPTGSLKITPSFYYQHRYFNDVPTFDPAGSNDPGDTFSNNWHTLNPTYSNVGDGHLVFQGLLLQPSSDQLSLPSLKGELSLARRQPDLQHLVPIPALHGSAGLYDCHAGDHRLALAAERKRSRRQLYAFLPKYLYPGSACAIGGFDSASAVDAGRVLYQVAPARVINWCGLRTGRRRFQAATGTPIQTAFGQNPASRRLFDR